MCYEVPPRKNIGLLYNPKRLQVSPDGQTWMEWEGQVGDVYDVPQDIEVTVFARAAGKFPHYGNRKEEDWAVVEFPSPEGMPLEGEVRISQAKILDVGTARKMVQFITQHVPCDKPFFRDAQVGDGETAVFAGGSYVSGKDNCKVSVDGGSTVLLGNNAVLTLSGENSSAQVGDNSTVTAVGDNNITAGKNCDVTIVGSGCATVDIGSRARGGEFSQLKFRTNTKRVICIKPGNRGIKLNTYYTLSPSGEVVEG